MAVSATATALLAAGGMRVQYDGNNDQYQVCPLCGGRQDPAVDPDSAFADLALRGWAAKHFTQAHGGTAEDAVALGFAAPPPASAPVANGAATATTQPLEWPDVPDADSYQVERAVSPFTAWTAVGAGAGGTPASSGTTVTGLTTATGYRYRVRSVKGGFQSAPSAVSATLTTP